MSTGGDRQGRQFALVYHGWRISNTCSGGRPIAALPFARTMGRSIKIGCLTMKSIRSPSDKDGLSSSHSAYTASFLRIRSRGAKPSWVRILLSFSAVGGVWRYSMMVGVIPCSPSSAKVWRDLLHFGL